MSESRREQVEGANTQSLFRDVNERIDDLNQAGPDTELLCECATSACVDSIPLTQDEYEAVRRVPTHFFVARGHVVPEIEHVVEENDRYMVVEKFEDAGVRAAKLDPRRRT